MVSTQASGQESLYRYRFGTAEFDEAAFELTVGGIPTEAQRKPLEILSLLLRHAGEIVTKDELLDTVWAGVPTVENVVANAVSKLRSALGDAYARHIVTQPRVGYRFDGTVERVAVGRRLASALALAPGMKVPGRENFTLERLIGRSSDCEVWTARQGRSGETRVYKFSPDGERLLALKREATLSRILHGSLGARPDIVRILDWNFETAPFFLECEFGGRNLVEWGTDDDRLRMMPLADRLAIFQQIAGAVAAAHGVGVLHKDLKPENVLVAPRGDGWQIRLTDFGSGRLLEPGRLAALGVTPHGLAMTEDPGASGGTPLYLAPELIAGGSATVKSDLYALGLILYQIVVGDFRRPLIPGWERDVPDELLREDIAASTDGDPARRLDSAAELSRRLGSLDSRRVERRRLEDAETRARIATEAVARNRARRPWLIATVATLTLGLVASLALYVRVLRSDRTLAVEVQTSRTLTRFLTDDLIAAADPKVTGRSNVTVAEAAKSAASRIDGAFRTAPAATRAALHGEMARAFAELTDFRAAAAEADLALAALRQQERPDDRAVADAQLVAAHALGRLARLPEAEARLQAVEALLQAPDLAGSELQVRYWMERGLLAAASLRMPDNLQAQETAWQLAQRVPDLSPRIRDQLELNLADAYRLTGKLTESESSLRRLIAEQTREYGADDARPVFATVVLANVLGTLQRYDEALRLLDGAVPATQRLLGADSLRTLQAKDTMAGIHYDLKHYDRAAALWTEVAAVQAAKMGESSVYFLQTQNNIGMANDLQGRHEVAEQMFRKALAKAEAAFAPTDPLVENIRYNLADCLLDLGRGDEVAALLDGLTPERLNMSEQEPDWPGRLAFQQGRLALLQGHAAPARALLEKASTLLGSGSADGSISGDTIRALLRQASTNP